MTAVSAESAAQVRDKFVRPDVSQKLGDRIRLFLPLAILIIAFGLRFFWIDRQSLWGDEGSTWDTVRGTLPEAIERTRLLDSLAPLYFVLLWAWTQAFGTSELGLRSLSAVAGVAGVGCVWLVAERLRGYRAACCAATLAAISPLWVYYSQEARPYALSATLAAGAAACALRLVEGQTVRGKWLAGYILSAAGSGLTQYFGVFAILATVLAVRQSRFGIKVWMAATAVAMLPLLLWIGTGWARFAGTLASGGPRGLPLPTYLTKLAEAFANGLPTPTGLPAAVLALGTAVALIGALGRGGLLPAGWLIVVIAGVELAGFPSDRPGPWVRYALTALPAFVVLQGLGVDRLWRRSALAGTVLLAALLCLSAFSLRKVYLDPALARFDFRGPVRQLAATVTPEDRVLANVGNLAFFYYYGDTQPAPIRFMEDVINTPDEQIRQRLADAVAGARRVFLVKYMPPEFDPKQRIEHWLNTHGTKTSEQWIEHIRLLSYDFGAKKALDDPAVQRVNARFGDDIELLGWFVPADTRAEQPTQITLYWRAQQPVATDHYVFVHVVAADDPERRVTQHDSKPALGSAPLPSWTPGDVVVDAHPLTLPAGEWLFSVGLADSVSGKRLTARVPGRPDDSRVLLGPIAVK